MYLSQPSHGVVAVVSVHGDREFPVDAHGIDNVLRLQFDDIETSDPSDPESMHRTWTRDKWAKEVGRPMLAPSEEHAKAIIEFANSIRRIDGLALFQCQGGISRSSAAALLCLAVWTGEGHELYCANEFSRVRPSACPLLGLVALGDRLIQRHGCLLSAAKGLR